MWLAVPVLFLLAAHASGGEEDNYMSLSGAFASVAAIEDMLLPELEVMERLMEHGERLEHALEQLRS